MRRGELTIATLIMAILLAVGGVYLEEEYGIVIFPEDTNGTVKGN